MGFIFGKKKKIERASNEFARGRPFISTWSNPPDRNTGEWIKEFERSPRLSVVQRIASDLSFAQGKLYRIKQDGTEEELKEHPFLEFWKHPNPLHEMTAAAIWQLLEIYLKLKGEGYFIIEKDSSGMPAELWPVPAHWVQMTPYLGYPFYKVKVSSGTIMDISVDDMFVMKELCPYDPFQRGLGQIEPLADEIETDEYAAKFQKRFFYNDATPNLVIGMPNSTKEQRDRFLANWKEMFKGMLNSHSVAVVNGDATVTKLVESMRDLDMVNGRIFLRDSVLEHFGVPREIMGITENSNRATAEAAQYIYAQNVLMPELKKREDAINQQLIPLFGSDLVWHFDDIVPKNQEFDKAKALDGWNSGLMMRDEARELLGIPPSKTGGNVYKTTFSDMFISEDDNPAEVSQMMDTASTLPTGDEMSDFLITNEDSNKSALNGHTAAEKANRLQAVQRTIEMAERQQTRRFEAATNRYFGDQTDRINAALFGSQKADETVWDELQKVLPDLQDEDELKNSALWLSLSEAERAALLTAFVNGMLDWTKEETELMKIFEPLWRESYDKGVGMSAQIYSIPGIQRPELISTAKLRGGQRVQHIVDTTKKRIAQIVSAGLEHGDGRLTIAKQIQQEMGTSSARAKTIASQECNASLMTGHFDMMRAAGAGTKKWHVTNPAVARDSHLKLNNVSVPIDSKFPNGCRFPCDPECNDASEVVNCHCFLTFDR